MAISRKIKKLRLTFKDNVVYVQANKNNGICDVMLVNESQKTVFDETTKKSYVIKIVNLVKHLPDFTSFYGRQFNDEAVIENLKNKLSDYFEQV